MEANTPRLPGFLAMRDPTDVRTQISLTDRLLHLVRRRYPDDMYYCEGGIHECTVAIDRARAERR